MHYTVHQIQQRIVIGLRADDGDGGFLIQPERAFVTESQGCATVGTDSYSISRTECGIRHNSAPTGYSGAMEFYYSLEGDDTRYRGGTLIGRSCLDAHKASYHPICRCNSAENLQ